MRCSRFYTLTISGDAERLKTMQLSSWHGLHYLLERLLTGQEVAESEWAHYGLSVKAREAVRNEIADSATTPRRQSQP